MYICIFTYIYICFTTYLLKTHRVESTAVPRFWSSGALWYAGSLAGLRFEVGRFSAAVGNVLVLGFVLIKISAILVLGSLGSILRRPGFDVGSNWERLGLFWTVWGST